MKELKETKKINKILFILAKNPEGLWIRQITRETKMPLSTVHYYIDKVINEIVDNIGVKDKKGKYFGLRIIRLKPKIRDLIEKKEMKKIYKILKICKNN